MEHKWFRIEKKMLNTWYPNSLEGWVVILAMALSVGFTFGWIYSSNASISKSLVLAFPFVSLIIAITIAIASFFGEKPVFGKENSETKNYNSDSLLGYLFLALLFLAGSAYYFSVNLLSAVAMLLVSLLLFVVFDKLKKA